MSGLTAAFNYLVPAAGSVRCYPVKQNFTTDPADLDWKQISNDAGDGIVTFIPSGVFIDNSQGTTPLVIEIPEMNYSIVTAPGSQKQAQYPAPMQQTALISGGDNANCSVIFVDFPVIPFESGIVGAIAPVEVVPGFDSAGDALPVGFFTLPQSFTYLAPGQIETIAVTDGVNTWTQTLTYTGTDVDTISGWVKT